MNVSLQVIVILGLRAIVILGLRVVVNVGHRAILFACFGNLPVQGRCCRNFELIVSCFFFCRAIPVEGDLEDLDRLRQHCGSAFIASPHHYVNSPPPRYPNFINTLGINLFFACLSL